jgi:hypothetical protein
MGVKSKIISNGALRLTSKNMTLNLNFLSDSSTLSLESLNAVAQMKFIYYTSQRQCVFLQHVPQTFAPHFVRRSKLSAERCADKPSFREEPFAPRTSRNIGKNSMLAQTNLQKKEIRSLARSFFSRSVNCNAFAWIKLLG